MLVIIRDTISAALLCLERMKGRRNTPLLFFSLLPKDLLIVYYDVILSCVFCLIHIAKVSNFNRFAHL